MENAKMAVHQGRRLRPTGFVEMFTAPSSNSDATVDRRSLELEQVPIHTPRKLEVLLWFGHDPNHEHQFGIRVYRSRCSGFGGVVYCRLFRLRYNAHKSKKLSPILDEFTNQPPLED